MASASTPPDVIPPARTAPRRPGATLARSLVIAVSASLVGIVAAVLPAAPAQAKPTAAQIASQIATLNDQIESVVEDYNGITTKLNKDLTQSQQLNATLGPAQLRSVVAQQRIGAIVRDLYMAGPSSGLAAILETGSTNDLIEQLGALDEIARSQRATVTSASALVTKYQNQSAALDKLITAEKAQKQELASKKADILGKLSNLNKLQAEAATATSAGSGGGTTAHAGTGSKSSLGYRMPVTCPQTTPPAAAKAAVAKACSLVKTLHWYGWAEAGPSRYDCSGLTMTAWAASGVSLEHFTGAQYSETTRISRSQLQVGDLVFYYSNHHHVAMYIGNGYIVQAQETGEPLKESPIGSPSAYGHPHK